MTFVADDPGVTDDFGACEDDRLANDAAPVADPALDKAEARPRPRLWDLAVDRDLLRG